MYHPAFKQLRRALSAALATIALAGTTLETAAHGTEHPPVNPRAAASAGTPVERFAGTVAIVWVEDRVVGMKLPYYALTTSTGRGLSLKGAIDHLRDGQRVVLEGQEEAGTLFVQSTHPDASGASPATEPAPKGMTEITGTLRLLHSDYFEAGRSGFMFDLAVDDGTSVSLDFAVLPDALQNGMRVTVTGSITGTHTLSPSYVVVTALPPLPPYRTKFSPNATTTNKVLVVMMRYANSPANPFTLAQVQQVFGAGAGSGSVTEFFKETSFGQQLLTPSYTNWQQSTANVPAGCNIGTVMNDGNALATAAGYNLSAYTNIVYVFPSISACGWAGLAYIGWGRALINGYNTTSVYAHELGHNFGLLHAGSLSCPNGTIVGGACSVSEYGDPFDTMGNQSAMHFNAMQKRILNWIPASSVLAQAAGAGAYALAPLESAGGTTYAVTLPTRKNRTFWLEYRQPIGFDAGLSSRPNNGAQVRLAAPLEWVCSGCGDDTTLLDMVPSTSTFNDATLVAGRNFRDPVTGVSMSVLGSTPTNLTLFVQMPGQPLEADFNGDGKADLLWRNPATGETRMSLMNGATAAANASLIVSHAWSAVHTGDFDGDGKADIMWRNSTTGETALWLMNGAQLVNGGGIMPIAAWLATHVADFNGDGKSDIVWRNLSTGETVIWLMNGMSIIAGVTVMTDATWIVSYTGDLNGDGKADIVWRNSVSGQTAAWLMNGTSITYGAGIMWDPNWTVTHLADFNADGKADIVWRNTNTGETALWLMNGLGITYGARLQINRDAQVTHVADLNGDGKSDIVWRDTATGYTSAWIMNGATPSAAASLLNDGSYTIARLGDLDANGTWDIVWRNSSTGKTMAWLMNGLSITLGNDLSTDASWFVQP